MSLASTRLLNARTNYPSNLDRQELRSQAFGMLALAIDSTNDANSIVTDQVQQMAMNSWGTPQLQIPVLGDPTLSVVDGRSCTFLPSESNSALVDVTFVTKTTGFEMCRNQNIENEISYENEFRVLFEKAEEKLAKEIETAIFGALDANKSVVYNSPLVGAGADYPLVGDAVQVSASLRDTFFNDATTIMMGDEFNAMMYDVVANPTLRSTVSLYQNQGAGNQTNTQFQFGPYNFYYSNDVVVGAGLRSAGYIMPKGSIALLSRLMPQEQRQDRSTTGVWWSNEFSQLLGMNIGIKYQSDCDDCSPKTGQAKDSGTLVEKWTLTVDFAILTPYNSDPVTLPGGIKKFELLTV